MRHLLKNFGSDNVAVADARVMAALMAANEGATDSYGADPWSERLERLMSELFEADVVTFVVATGTAANALALSAMAPPFGSIYCDEVAHIMNDEGGAPEFYTAGAKLLTLPSSDGRIDPEELARSIARRRITGVHQSPASAVSVTQATEWGTVYPVDQVRAITEVAHANAMPVHMDGARFANAVAHLGCTPAQASWKAGIDVLSFGATKNGAFAAEAVLFFRHDLAEQFARRRKRAGHLFSKQRFLSAQWIGLLEDEVWLHNATRANEAASRLAEGLAAIAGVVLVHEVQSNEVFVRLPEAMILRLEAAGYGFYRWAPSEGDAGSMVRLVCAYNTSASDVDALIAEAKL